MSEEGESIQEDDFLVRVKAQVMTRDDSSGGWVALKGGGLSIVGLRKISVIANSDEGVRYEYVIHGYRTSDQEVVLHCMLKKDVQYTKATPTFHHWRTGDRRFGLTFQTAADARAFDKGIKRAVEDLLGSPNSSNSLEVGDDDVFMPLDLPLRRQDSSSQSAQSASTNSTTTSSPTPHSPITTQDVAYQSPTRHHPPPLPPLQTQTSSSSSSNVEHLKKINYVSSRTELEKEEVWIKNHKKEHKDDKDKDGSGERIDLGYSYVQFQKPRQSVHDYQYPNIDSKKERKDSLSSIKKNNLTSSSNMAPLPLPTKKKKKHKDSGKSDYLLQRHVCCQYCNLSFDEQSNTPGSCKEAPDRVHNIIEKVSCLCCAEAVLYHCYADEDGRYGHVCACDTSEDKCCLKWITLTILSFFVPCLCCYLPLRACHRCGIRCGCCGGRHQAK
ncbi:sprouty-related, EVH1 domain-containing protein 2 isoform X2 [Lingula anatina]|uniref:Sprouty-related, EVH1 domain-containing protein 2 isoform X2 n=1 Tax=Lingula anatina TaxID=7574 RepID=A0A1S3HK37_LINAN|nr:sprouty-related, EVH1 domain-containing protein 2 isoform X2 [Lingula anatina]|eukprot:XP_013386483.1 sprouty-related, EVH1 domain-containing protein 2 isoform X2 [Lingula anatina]